ncbi:MAG: PadR family transcriptional regulator [Propionibacteriales bacterium]|nr:PadR family transcriptional regulator [Propionibacteriales bacterium]
MNATAAALLGLLDTSGDELTGGELARLAQTRIGDFWTVTRSQVYRELATLEQQGYIKAGATGPRDARPYRLTRSGRSTYKRWLVEELPAATVRVPLLLALAFGSVLPADKLRALVTASRDEHAQRLAGYRELEVELREADVDPYTRATLSFGMHYEEAVLRWFEALPADIAPRS